MKTNTLLGIGLGAALIAGFVGGMFVPHGSKLLELSNNPVSNQSRGGCDSLVDGTDARRALCRMVNRYREASFHHAHPHSPISDYGLTKLPHGELATHPPMVAVAVHFHNDSMAYEQACAHAPHDPYCTGKWAKLAKQISRSYQALTGG